MPTVFSIAVNLSQSTLKKTRWQAIKVHICLQYRFIIVHYYPERFTIHYKKNNIVKAAGVCCLGSRLNWSVAGNPELYHAWPSKEMFCVPYILTCLSIIYKDSSEPCSLLMLISVVEGHMIRACLINVVNLFSLSCTFPVTDWQTSSYKWVTMLSPVDFQVYKLADHMLCLIRTACPIFVLVY